MAAIDEMNLARVASASDESAAKRVINELFWNWFTLHQNDRVVKVKWWFVSKTVYVHDLKDVFVLLVGPNPRY